MPAGSCYHSVCLTEVLSRFFRPKPSIPQTGTQIPLGGCLAVSFVVPSDFILANSGSTTTLSPFKNCRRANMGRLWVVLVVVWSCCKPTRAAYRSSWSENDTESSSHFAATRTSGQARRLGAPPPPYVTTVSTVRMNPAASNFRSADDELAPVMRGICNIPSFNPCVPLATCVPTVPIIGSATCICPSGYVGDGLASGEGCVDINECATGANDCDPRTTVCIDLPGSYRCECKNGFLMAPNGRTCLDIDECQNPALNDCDLKTMRCHNLEGSYRCVCKDPQQIMDSVTKRCRDLNECEDMNGVMNPCEQLCFDRVGGFECGCREGYTLARDGVSCADVDECADPTLNACDPTGVVSRCQNEVGGYRCLCNIALGYTDGPDGISCVNLDECARDPYICGGAISCCKDLFPPQRFACTVPLDDQLGHTPPLGGVTAQKMNAVLGSSPLTSWIPSFMGIENSATLAVPRVLLMEPPQAPSDPVRVFASTPDENSEATDEVGKQPRWKGGLPDGLVLFEEGNSRYLGIIAGNDTTQMQRWLETVQAQQMPEQSEAESRQLQLLTALKPGSPHIPGEVPRSRHQYRVCLRPCPKPTRCTPRGDTVHFRTCPSIIRNLGLL